MSKFFGRKGYIVTALEDVSLTVNLSENIAIVGETGSGKSTLGRISCGLEKPSKGKVLLSGKEIGSYRKNELWKTTYLGFTMKALAISILCFSPPLKSLPFLSR